MKKHISNVTFINVISKIFLSKVFISKAVVLFLLYDLRFSMLNLVNLIVLHTVVKLLALPTNIRLG
jgi:hypothetical protein